MNLCVCNLKIIKISGTFYYFILYFIIYLFYIIYKIKSLCYYFIYYFSVNSNIPYENPLFEVLKTVMENNSLFLFSLLC